MPLNIPKKRIESLERSLEKKQNKLVAGANISIDETDPENPVISLSGTGNINYVDIENKPSINDIELNGNKTLNELGIYGENNLLAGKNIEIIDEPVEGGIDEHAVACWHCDDDLVDSVGGSITLKGGLDTTYKHFGTGSIKCSVASSQTTTSISSLGFNSNNSILTIDYWVYIGANVVHNSSVGILGIDLNFKNSQIASGGGKFANSFSQDLELNKWYHVATVYDAPNGIIDVYLDGTKIATSTINKSGYSDFSALSVWGYLSSFYVDELRISNVRRYNEDFTPPTKPYSVAIPTGNKVINNILDISNLATKEEVTTVTNQIGSQVSVIESKIPAEASETNQLADKNYVDSVSSGSGFDFEGTKAEFDAAVAAGTITEDSVSLVTDDVEGDNVATKAELQAVESEANNLTNLTVQGKSLVSGLGMPSDRYIDLTLGANGTTYTAPANGYFVFRGNVTAQRQYVYIGDPTFNRTGFQFTGVDNGDWIVFTLPVAKNSTILINYNTGANNRLVFVYAEGDK